MGGASIQFYQTRNGPCPYLTERNWDNLAFQSSRVSDEAYTSLLNQGFRRSGLSIYHPVCSDCSSCIPLRVNTRDFQSNRGQRRTWRKNQDLRVEHRPLEFCEEGFQLYRRYQLNWHRTSTQVSEVDYLDFLISSPVKSEMHYYYAQNRLLGIGWVDMLPNLLSSVYFIFEPDEASRRLGVYSLLYEIEFCRKLNKSWLYLGYWVEDSRKMAYKCEFRPAEVLLNFQWIPLENTQLVTKEAHG